MIEAEVEVVMEAVEETDTLPRAQGSVSGRWLSSLATKR